MNADLNCRSEICVHRRPILFFSSFKSPREIAIPILHTLRRFPENTIVLLFYCDKLDPAPDPSVVAFALP
jgi:hypothetical protein